MSERLSYEMVEVVKGDRFVDPLAAPVIKDLDRVPMEFDAERTSFYKSSNLHGRSFEDLGYQVISRCVLEDENEDLYFRLSIKGASTSEPSGRFSELEPNYIRINGMLDSSTFTRVEAISRHLRREGVLTEWPIYHARPKRFPSLQPPDEEPVLHTWPKMWQKVINYYEATHRYNIQGLGIDKLDSIGQYGAALQGLMEFKPGVMYRAMLTNDRIAELPNFSVTGILSDRVKFAIRSLQRRNPDHLWCIRDIKGLYADRPEDQFRYLEEVLPQIMGENLARLHTAGAYHHYPHMGNWTIAGELVDLDSVHCEELFADDAPHITVINRLNEVAITHQYLQKIPEIPGLPIDRVKMGRAFANSYFAERNLAENIEKPEQIIIDCMFGAMPESSQDLGDPEIITFSDEMIAEMTLEIAAGLDNAGDNEADLLKEMKAWVSKYGFSAVKQIEAYFEDNGLTELPEWVDIDDIASVELYKLHTMILKQINKMFETGLTKNFV